MLTRSKVQPGGARGKTLEFPKSRPNNMERVSFGGRASDKLVVFSLPTFYAWKCSSSPQGQFKYLSMLDGKYMSSRVLRSTQCSLTWLHCPFCAMPILYILRTIKKEKEKSTPAKRPRALRKGSLTSKPERVSPKGPQA
eukprot:1155216-Pelagomonas_calceolata.AAC.1